MVKMPSKASKQRVNRLVNELGDVRQEIERLQEREAILKDKLKSAGVYGAETGKYKFTLSSYYMTRVDYAGLVAHLKVTERVIRKFSHMVPVLRATIKSLEEE